MHTTTNIRTPSQGSRLNEIAQKLNDYAFKCKFDDMDLANIARAGEWIKDQKDKTIASDIITAWYAMGIKAMDGDQKFIKGFLQVLHGLKTTQQLIISSLE